MSIGIEHILVPELELGITISREPHRYRGKVSLVEDLNSLVSHKRLALYRRDMERAHKDSRVVGRGTRKAGTV